MLLLWSCSSSIEVNNRKFYLDYDFHSHVGICEIRKLPKYLPKDGSFIEIVYRDDMVDSILIHGILKNPIKVKLTIGRPNDVYEIYVRDDFYGDRKSFLAVRENLLKHYIFKSPIVYVDSTMDGQNN